MVTNVADIEYKKRTWRIFSSQKNQGYLYTSLKLIKAMTTEGFKKEPQMQFCFGLKYNRLQI